MVKPVPLVFNFFDISDEAKKYAEEFFELCRKKFAIGEEKHGYVRGDTPFRKIYEHLLEEVGELLVAMDDELWSRGLLTIMESAGHRLVDKKDRDIVGELADITNMPVLVYICGRVQKELR